MQCYKREGIIKTTVEHVAREARVSRTTVYRYFANRDEILTALVARESLAMFAKMRAVLDGIDDFADYIVEAVVFCLQEAPTMPLYHLAFGREGAAMTSRLMFTSEELFEMVGEFVRPNYERALREGQIPEDMELLWIVDWAVRIALSYITTSNSVVTTADEQRRLFQTFLKPAFLQGRG